MHDEARKDGPAPRRRVVVGITGETGMVYAVRLLEVLRELPVETHLVMCECARDQIAAETGLDPDVVAKLADRSYHFRNQAARISSGSFLTEGMIVAPCSMKSLAAIAQGMATNLIHRAADVTVKEGRRLALLIRQGPLSPIHLETMSLAARGPAVLVSPEAAASPAVGLEGMVDRTVAGLLDQVGIEHGLVAT
jgi:4-hydroxy-3-polyprenylbenzoate decarboxylase